jgi:hypothetical protein
MDCNVKAYVTDFCKNYKTVISHGDVGLCLDIMP